MGISYPLSRDQMTDPPAQKKKKGILSNLIRDFRYNKWLYFMVLPVVAYYLIFCYAPLYGLILAFKDFSPMKGVLGSSWVGLRNFTDYFSSIYAFRTIKNTFLLSFYGLLWGFPAPIILALMINEVKNVAFKRVAQTITYLPHFISIVVVCGMIVTFTQKDGIINDIIAFFGGHRILFMQMPNMFRTIYISTNIWQGIGWGSIIYLAALAGIDQELYEAATMDGASRWAQTIHVTLPGIMPTVVIMLILSIGSLMSVGFEKIILLYNPLTYSTADVISSYVYRMGLVNNNFGLATAVGLFNSVINLILVVGTNYLSRKTTETSLW